MEIKEMISMTIACDKCKGKGKQKDKKTTCEKCAGSGMIIDNFIPDTIMKHTTGTTRAQLGKCITEIYAHYGDKLMDAYKRGVVDGRYIAKEAKKDKK